MARLRILLVIPEERRWRRAWRWLAPLFGKMLERVMQPHEVTPHRGEGAPALYVICTSVGWRNLTSWLACWRDARKPAPVVVLAEDLPDRRRDMLFASGVSRVVPLGEATAEQLARLLIRRHSGVRARKPGQSPRARTDVGFPRRCPAPPSKTDPYATPR